MAKCTFRIAVPQPFSLRATALSHGWHECSPLSWCEGGQCLQLVERVNGEAVRVSIRQGKTGTRNVTLDVTAEAMRPVTLDTPWLAERVRATLSLHDDLSPFFELCRDHPVLHVLPAIGAGRSLRSASFTEAILKALLATNVNWTQAVKMINRMGQLGPPLRHFVHLAAWPTPREILRAGEGYLLEVCRVGYRTESILEFCRRVVDGSLDPDSWVALARDPAVNNERLLSNLRSIRGIGPSSANFLLGMLGRNGHLSIDSSTIAHVARVHTDGERPTNRQIESIYAPYGEWKQLVWWFEHWLTWETARRMLREAGLEPPI